MKLAASTRPRQRPRRHPRRQRLHRRLRSRAPRPWHRYPPPDRASSCRIRREASPILNRDATRAPALGGLGLPRSCVDPRLAAGKAPPGDDDLSPLSSDVIADGGESPFSQHLVAAMVLSPLSEPAVRERVRPSSNLCDDQLLASWRTANSNHILVIPVQRRSPYLIGGSVEGRREIAPGQIRPAPLSSTETATQSEPATSVAVDARPRRAPSPTS